ncbi:hypothetical protein BGZ70_000822 [Mortierella alpina]|uniref:F-box domain-containing protein n=1 Tax=Mortierella alpina TaxID=64518 RepID=A0A9P6JC80_MORAP|nr:hypothetical protein BGZ70_000822 [Mortierella alpina]
MPPLPLPISVTATAIPEIALLIAKDLCKPDLSSCSRVCRTWSHIYTPLLWRDLHAHVPDADPLLTPTSDTPSASPVSLLLKNGAFIKNLSIVDNNADRPCVSDLIYDRPAVQNLIRLTASSIQHDIISPTRNIVHRNSDTLRVLWLVFHGNKIQNLAGGRRTALFEFPSRMPLLQSLYLQHWQLSRHQLISILKACPSLKLLSFDIHITGDHDEDDLCNGTTDPKDASDQNKDKDEETVFQHQRIETFRMCSRLYMIMEHLPRVKLLEFYRFDRQLDTLHQDRFCQSIREHCLDLQELWAYGFECSMLPAVLDSMPRLVTFRGSSDMATVLSILDHAATLEEANLADYSEKTFLPLQFLESCPRLTMFWTGHSMTTIAQVQESLERGWVCRDLKELRLSIFKLSPLLIEAIMQELGAHREPDSRTSKMRARVIKQGQIMGLEQQQLQRQHELDLQAAIDMLLPDQKAFQKQFAVFLKRLVYLRRLNFGTGWYRVKRSAGPNLTGTNFFRNEHRLDLGS